MRADIPKKKSPLKRRENIETKPRRHKVEVVENM